MVYYKNIKCALSKAWMLISYICEPIWEVSPEANSVFSNLLTFITITVNFTCQLQLCVRMKQIFSMRIDYLDCLDYYFHFGCIHVSDDELLYKILVVLTWCCLGSITFKFLWLICDCCFIHCHPKSILFN